MFFQRSFIPYGGYWSTPFCRWQGSLAQLHAIPFAADIAARALEERGISPRVFDSLYFGITVPQRYSFYGGPWLTGLVGAETIAAPMIGQACATAARLMAGDPDHYGRPVLERSAHLLSQPNGARWNRRNGGLGVGQLRLRSLCTQCHD
jgi:hypothetical protein